MKKIYASKRSLVDASDICAYPKLVLAATAQVCDPRRQSKFSAPSISREPVCSLFSIRDFGLVDEVTWSHNSRAYLRKL